MKRVCSNLVIVALISCLVFLALCVPPLDALRVTGSLFKGTVKPGETVIHTMTVGLRENEPPEDVLVEVMGFSQSKENTYRILEPSDDTGPYSARTFISVDKTAFHLETGASTTLNATIKVPQNVGNGGRYALIYIHTTPRGSGSAGFAAAVLVPIFVTISGSDLIHTGTITDIHVSEAVPGHPIEITTVVQNTGNHHFSYTVDEVTIRDSTGKEITTLTKQMNTSIVPPFSVGYGVTVDTPLSVGTYTATSRVKLEDGSILDEESTAFEVKMAYVPPFSEVSVTVSPGSTAVLAADNGKIEINFPAGAVLGSTKVTMKPVIPGNLPKAPEGVKRADTAFSVEGLTGLLAKDATITVKYSAEDRNAAGGNAAKLFLARYDSGENKWTPMPTSVDQNAGTLTVTTNRLSIWSVMVSEGEVPMGTGAIPETTKTPGFTLGIAMGALLLIFITNHLRRKE